MAKVAVVYWSGTGNTEAMAELIVEAAQGAGAEVESFSVSDEPDISGYDVVAFGCPAMGDEELEEGEFEPYYAGIEDELEGRKIALFGSYSWAEGEWMEKWTERAKEKGAVLVAESLAVFEAPEDEGEEKCKAFGEALANA
ncbi:MAG: flavodoxin [Eubacteriales bacterium]|nr:flavodoxin [Eubacteriales bacterium]